MANSFKFAPFVAAIGGLSLAGCGSDEQQVAENETPTSPSTALVAAPPATDRVVHDDIIYFVMPDRFENGDTSNDHGGLEGDKFTHGFDPTDKAFYHGGDMRGLLNKLDYLENLGVTAIWMTPIFKNKAVQGDVNGVSAGYHGYWITDFTQIDPHLGTNDDLKTLVAAAHARGMKVIFDIITNHTADVIKYRECAPQTDANGKPAKATACAYRSIADYPYTRRASDGADINAGFAGDGETHQTPENFAKLTDLTWAYTPYVPEAEKNVKMPAWLNDPAYYHNRGETTFEGENSLYGDFASLDDVFTEHPRVVEGMIDIYKYWISEFNIDGFRVDTVRHVNMSFWRALSPALIDHAKAEGLEEFYIFGEVFDPNPHTLSTFVRDGKLPSVLDFGFQSAAMDMILGSRDGTKLSAFFDADDYYTIRDVDARDLPTFLGNHDMGRFGLFIQGSDRNTDPAAALELDIMGHVLMYGARGVPVIYYGDEQGFTGDGNDQAARENMEPSRVDSYNDNVLIGTDATTAEANYDEAHPVYVALKALADVRKAEPALRSGSQITRLAGADHFAFSRVDMATGQEILVVMNSGDSEMTLDIPVGTANASWVSLLSDQALSGDADSVSVAVPARTAMMLKADKVLESGAFTADPRILIGDADETGGRFLTLTDTFSGPAHVSWFKATDAGEMALGTDISPPYRLYVDDTNIEGQAATIIARIKLHGGDARESRVFFPLASGNGSR